MEAFRQDTENSRNILNKLQKKMLIKIWENLITLPSHDLHHSELELNWELKIGFTFSRPLKGEEKVSIFLSEKTEIARLLQILPFWFQHYQLYLCINRLIQERLSALGQDEDLRGDNQATQQLNFLLSHAAMENASDLHLESLPDGKQVRMRVDGRLSLVSLKEDVEENLFMKVKLVSGMDIAQKRAPQDGHFQYVSEQGKKFDLRTSTIPGVHGEKVVIRLLPATSIQFSMEGTNFSNENIALINQAISSHTGLILMTGPTGSGKTTSLYAILNALMSESINTITVEDPVEYRLPNITQVEVNELAGVTFASALRSFLRQDPDVILVGEIRDQETAQIAARAAQTGHLVLSTLHSNNVFEAIHRLQTLGVQGDDIASSLKMLISQRLITKLCACGGQESSCPHCLGRGQIGRLPLQEILPISPTLRKMLSRCQSISEIESQAKAEGFRSLRQNGEELVAKKLILQSELDNICPL